MPPPFPGSIHGVNRRGRDCSEQLCLPVDSSDALDAVAGLVVAPGWRDRAELVGDTARLAGTDPVRRWFNTKAFTKNAPGTFGNSGRNIVPGPGRAAVNMMLSNSRTFLGESSVHFPAEFFSMTNHPNFVSKRSERLTSATFGRLPGAGDPGSSSSAPSGSFEVR